MNTLQQTVRLNSFGVTCLTSASTDGTATGIQRCEALSSFKSGLTMLSNACAHQTVPEPVVMSSGTMLRISVQRSRPIAVAQAQRCAFYIVSDEPAESYEAYSVQSAVLLFNLALGLHQKGALHKDPISLRRACCLYEHCLELLATVAAYFQDAEAVTCEALKNLADIYSQVGNDGGLRCVLDALVLMHLRDVVASDERMSSWSLPAPAA